MDAPDIIDSLPEITPISDVPEDTVIATGEPIRSRAGRPRVPIDQLTVLKLARLHCSNYEIAEWFGVTESLIRRRFGDLIRQCQAETRARIRHEQIRQALNGNVTMLIFLGKVMLGQREDSAPERTEPLPWRDEE